MTNKSYASVLFTSAHKAAKVCGCDYKALLANYRSFKTAPAELKRPLLLMYKIMQNYKKATPAVAVETEPET